MSPRKVIAPMAEGIQQAVQHPELLQGRKVLVWVFHSDALMEDWNVPA